MAISVEKKSSLHTVLITRPIETSGEREKLDDSPAVTSAYTCVMSSHQHGKISPQT